MIKIKRKNESPGICWLIIYDREARCKLYDVCPFKETFPNAKSKECPLMGDKENDNKK